uniref:Uncharacterized protein n=1 Tax=Phaeomonas parva TaxID=124430 RepID=A0A7S1UIN4_9STRA|mmetsp:Transcript_7100/g.20744  ORF Transcript_7100/g.20744 Transcript_7100/m.20744 type:complete len:599 (+) Transcript_7100:221-2017(+)|eukprot:CAMPEP_0118856528 /NCGR_PEP_ID=MMETSP1163-20130328/3967_1 /TAXON_ID=124430 /ORGANISM="Phaeomonas parva, Strain CCMP2877" /LENGTH=598 /DNA_ID=CAMNT_0006789653 /DNA_START=184 /DNA_END=1980 /DNA_ORIENTATION=-
MSVDTRPAHSWTLPQQHLDIVDEVDHANDVDGIPITLLQAEEAERLVEGLRAFGPNDVGGPAWMAQHQNIQRLNMQAHASAKANADEFVVEAVLTFEKLPTLVRELLLIEAWKEQALPKIISKVDKGPASMRAYFVLYHEVVLCNFLETLLYHDYGVAACGDHALELVDYCARKLTRLNSRHGLDQPLAAGMEEADEKGSLREQAEKRASATAESELTAQLQETELAVCLAALRIARFLAEHLEKLPLAAFGRMCETHDVLMLTVPLLDNPPWARRRREAPPAEQENEAPAEDDKAAKKKKKKKKGKWVWEKLDVNNKWAKVAPADLLTLTPLEVNAWLIVFFLTCNTEIRKSYHLNTFRKGQLLKARKFINDIVLDQLPVLADVQRLMDELAVVDVPEPSGLDNTGLMMQQVALERERLVNGTDWVAAAAAALAGPLSKQRGLGDLQDIAELYTGDEVLDFLEPRSAEQEAAEAENQEELLKRLMEEAQAEAAKAEATEPKAVAPAAAAPANPNPKPKANPSPNPSPNPTPTPKPEPTPPPAPMPAANPSPSPNPNPKPESLDDLWDEALGDAVPSAAEEDLEVDEEIDLTDPDALD